MTTIVGIFDDAWNVEKAIEQLAAAGFEDTVYDEAILAEQPGSAGAIPFRAPGSAPEKVLGENAPNLISKPDRRIIVEAFKAQLVTPPAWCVTTSRDSSSSTDFTDSHGLRRGAHAYPARRLASGG